MKNIMTKVIIIKNPDKTVSVLYPMPAMFDRDSRDRQDLLAQGINFENDDKVLDFIIEKDVPAGASFRITDISNLPSPGLFRGAWHDENLKTETVDVDIEVAKAIKRDQLRAIRTSQLESLDTAYLKADEEGNIKEKQRIAKEKQQLRDITEIELPDDLVKLKNFIPDLLK